MVGVRLLALAVLGALLIILVRIQKPDVSLSAFCFPILRAAQAPIKCVVPRTSLHLIFPSQALKLLCSQHRLMLRSVPYPVLMVCKFTRFDSLG